MVDVTFPFIILFGGPLAAWMTALVRGHRGGRKALDILAGAICGPMATTLWMSLAGHLFARGPSDTYMSREWASFLADLLCLALRAVQRLALVRPDHRRSRPGSPRATRS